MKGRIRRIATSTIAIELLVQLLLLSSATCVVALSGVTVTPTTTATGLTATDQHHHQPPEETTTTTTPRQVSWLIVGGGIHGVHIATRLLGEGLTDDLCIVDDADVLLSKWKTRTAATGMEYLRSSAGYHLDLREDSLRRFASAIASQNATTTKSRSSSSSKSGVLFAKDYERPRLDLFNQHCDKVIAEYQLDDKHVQGRVIQLEPHEDHVRVQVSCKCSSCSPSTTKQVEVMADHVVLALGNDQPVYPEWVTQELVDSGMVQHLFHVNDTDTDTITHAWNDAHSVAIIGGGISAGHKALQLAQKEGKAVHLISRHKIVEQQFDTHQDWMMDQAAAQRSRAGGGTGLPQRQRRFQATPGWHERRQMIARERIPGTVTAAVNRGRQGLQYAIQQKLVQWHQTQVERVHLHSNDHNQTCTLHLCTGERVEVNRILLATGFGKRPPSLVKPLEDNLPVSEFCGYPIVDPTLQWGHERIFVTGALAELELGPSARNIAGARLAAERILQACQQKQ